MWHGTGLFRRWLWIDSDIPSRRCSEDEGFGGEDTGVTLHSIMCKFPVCLCVKTFISALEAVLPLLAACCLRRGVWCDGESLCRTRCR